MTRAFLLVFLLAPGAQACMELASFGKLFRDGGAAEPAPSGVPEAVVLFDHTAAHAEPLDPASAALAEFNTGECLKLLERRAAPGEPGRVTSYRVSRQGSPPGWVDAGRVYAFNHALSDYEYQVFLDGGALEDAPSVGLQEVQSRAFALRASRNKTHTARVAGLRRLLGLSKGEDALEPWLALQEEADPQARRAADWRLSGHAELPRGAAFWERLARAVDAEPSDSLDVVARLVAKSGHPEAWRLLSRLRERGSRDAPTLLAELDPARALDGADPEVRARAYLGTAPYQGSLLPRLSAETERNRRLVAERLLKEEWGDRRVRDALEEVVLDTSTLYFLRGEVLEKAMLGNDRLEGAERADWLRAMFERPAGNGYAVEWLDYRCQSDDGPELSAAAARYGAAAAAAAAARCMELRRARNAALHAPLKPVRMAHSEELERDRLSPVAPARR